MTRPFKKVDPKVSFPELEKKVLDFWNKEDIFKKSLKQTEDQPPYVFYDGPPFATGLPHHGHLLAGTIKDIIPRYQTMKGRYVQRRFGWDCHGLPVEMEVQKNLGLNTRKEIISHGIKQFNESCRSIVQRYSSEWEQIIARLGRWIDFENDYKTMDTPFMESVWWVFKTLYDKGLIYHDYKVVPYSWAASSILSNFEANLEYHETDDPSIVVKFAWEGRENTYFLSWTTTPWTLVANLGLCLNPTQTYVRLVTTEDGKEVSYILGKNFVDQFFKDKPYKIAGEKKGVELVGTPYRPVFDMREKDFFPKSNLEGVFKILNDPYVSDKEGTGIVQIAPVFGEDDFRIGKKYKLPHFDPVDEDGNFFSTIDSFANTNIKQSEKQVMADLKSRGLLFYQGTIRHSYPFCWRTDKPLMYKAISSWFVNVDKIKKTIIDANKKINWVPGHIKNGRFGKWLENSRDWAISRNRFWGTPIPVWVAEDGEKICIGDCESLEKLSGKKVTDLHKHNIDDIIIEKDGKTFKRVREVLDCWFESGSMPYAEDHYPFEKEKSAKKRFPADFIAEGLDQTRGWFYTLLVIGAGLFGKSPYKNVIVNGLILAEDGKKMSKRLKNYPEPMEVFDTFGADALRIYLISSAVIRGETLRFSNQGLENVVKTIFLPLWNAFSFFSNYAHIDKWSTRDKIDISHNKNLNRLDRWILSVFQTLVKDVERAMDEYKLYLAVPPIISFIDKLTNIYIRRSRRRFWKSDSDHDKFTAYSLLYTILKDLTRVLAPFAPFISEAIYSKLREDDEPISVHLTKFPSFNQKQIHLKTEQDMEWVNEIVSLARTARIENQLKIRQPISKMTVISNKNNVEKSLEPYQTIIKEELNIKEIAFTNDEVEFVNLHAKANFRVLGKKYGQKVKAINAELIKLDTSTLLPLLAKKAIKINLEGKSIKLSPDEIDLKRTEKKGLAVCRGKNFAVNIDTSLNEELQNEGIAREFVHIVQRIRKEMQLNYVDRISLAIASEQKTTNAISTHKTYIMKETLATSIEFKKQLSTETGNKLSKNNQFFHEESDLNNNKITIFINKETP